MFQSVCSGGECMAKVSVIVAVYNGEKYLDRCLDSLCRQTFSDIEIVCVDDASTDSSLQKLWSRAEDDSRIKVLHHDDNSGPAVTRNEALSVCTGDIIACLDCDDWYADNTIERIVKVFDAHDDADCVLFRCMMVYSDGREEDYHGLTFDSLDGKTAFRESLTWHVHGIYAARRHLYDSCKFDATCRHYSDDNTTRIHYYLSRRVYSSDAPYYYYQNPASISHVVSVSRMDYMRATESMKHQLEELYCPHDIMELYENQRWLVLVDAYKFYFDNRRQLSSEDAAYCLGEIKRNFALIDTSLLRPSLKFKFGYSPLFKSWTFFRLQEEIYFRVVSIKWLCQIVRLLSRTVSQMRS